MAEIKFLDKTGLTQVISHLQQDTDEKITTAIEGVTYVSGDESEDAELMPVDADTLGGQLPEYYATAQGLEDLRAEVEAGGGGTEVPDGVIYMNLDSAGESIDKIYNDADSLGGESAEEWQKKIDDVVDGTTVVAEATKATFDGDGNNISDTYLNKTATAVDSEKLGGKNASEYVLDFEVVEDVNSITKSGFYRCTTNLPFDYALANVIMVGDTSNSSNIPTQIAFGIDLNPTTRDLIAVRSYDGSNWTGWVRVAKNTDLANYLPLDGSKALTGSVGIIAPSSGTKVKGYYLENSDGTNYMSLGMHSVDGVVDYVYLGPAYSKSRNLSITPDEIKWKNNDLLHTGSKPTGTYTGNGSSETRYFSIQGVGKKLVIYSDNGVVFVFDKISVWISSDGTVSITKSGINYDGITLGFYSSSPLLNASGITYTYSVL